MGMIINVKKKNLEKTEKTLKKEKKQNKITKKLLRILKGAFTVAVIGVFAVSAWLNILNVIRKTDPNFLVDYHSLKGEALYTYMTYYKGDRDQSIEAYFTNLLNNSDWTNSNNVDYFNFKAVGTYYYEAKYYNMASKYFKSIIDYAPSSEESFEITLYLASCAYYADDVKALNGYGIGAEDVSSMSEVDPRDYHFYYDDVPQNIRIFKKNTAKYGCKYGDFDGTLDNLEKIDEE